MNDHDSPSRMTEPIPISDVFNTSVLVEMFDDFVRITGYSLLQTDGTIGEKRVVSRNIYPHAVGRVMMTDLRRAYTKGGH